MARQLALVSAIVVLVVASALLAVDTVSTRHQPAEPPGGDPERAAAAPASGRLGLSPALGRPRQAQSQPTPDASTPGPPAEVQLVPEESGIQGPVGGESFVLLRSKDLTPGAELTVMGLGFQAEEQVVVTIVDLEDRTEAELGSVLVDTEGRFNDISLAVPDDLAPGDHILRVFGTLSSRVAQATFRLHRIPAKVTLDSFTGKPGHTFEFSGSGFLPGEEVEVRLGDLHGQLLVTIPANADGTLLGQATVPQVAAGNYALYFVGLQSQLPVSVGFNVQEFAPWLILDNYSPLPYQLVGFTGQDFAPGEEVRFYLDERIETPILQLTAGDGGRIEAEGAIEAPASSGDHTVTLIGQRSSAVVTASFTVLPFAPSLELTNYAGRPGTQVGFTGTGWARNETLNAFLGEEGAQQRVATFRADKTGSFSGAGTFTIPADAGPGAIPLTIVGDVSQVPVTVYYAVLELQPSAELTTYVDISGTEVSFTGRGFATGEPVTVHLASRDGPSLTTAVTDAEGNFEQVGAYTVTGNVHEVIPFVMVGAGSGAEATTHFRITSQ